MTTNELRAKFEVLPCPFCGGVPVDHLKIHGRCIECQGCGASGPELPLGGDASDMERLWNSRSHVSRDAEIEALRKDVARLNWLEQDMKAGSDGTSIYYCLGRFCYPYLGSSGVGEKSESTLRKAIDAAMQEESK